MKQQPNHFLSLGILAAAILAAVLGMLASNSQAQPSGKTGAEKVGAAAKTSAAAAKTGDKAAAKPKETPKAEVPKTDPPAVVKEVPPAVQESPKPKPEIVLPPALPDSENSALKPKAKPAAPSPRKQGLMAGLTIFVLAIFVGFDVINRVPTTLHTPLMSGSNAISGITVVGALIAAGQGFHFSSFLGFFAVALAMINVVGGFLVTHRMLLMFKRK